jgi:hypothetical protein
VDSAIDAICVLALGFSDASFRFAFTGGWLLGESPLASILSQQVAPVVGHH